MRISTHAPRTGSDRCWKTQRRNWRNFNPRSPHGERPTVVATVLPSTLFQPTLPARGATLPVIIAKTPVVISTHAPRTGSDSTLQKLYRICDISTHAPRTGSDAVLADPLAISNDFNPRSPHGERHKLGGGAATTRNFNPRSPHGERPSMRLLADKLDDFNPRSPHGERRWADFYIICTKAISTHAPRTGSDTPAAVSLPASPPFQPTLPARGATHRALRRGHLRVHHFNPRSPHGERRARA